MALVARSQGDATCTAQTHPPPPRLSRGESLILSMMITTLYLHRLVQHNLPPRYAWEGRGRRWRQRARLPCRQHRPPMPTSAACVPAPADYPCRELMVSVFLPVAPLAKATLSLAFLGTASLRLTASGGTLVPFAPGFQQAGVFAALTLWGGAAWWLIIAVLSISTTIRELPFSAAWCAAGGAGRRGGGCAAAAAKPRPACCCVRDAAAACAQLSPLPACLPPPCACRWSLLFPLGTFAQATVQLSNANMLNWGAFKAVGAGLSAATILAWSVCTAATLIYTWRRQLQARARGGRGPSCTHAAEGCCCAAAAAVRCPPSHATEALCRASLQGPDLGLIREEDDAADAQAAAAAQAGGAANGGACGSESGGGSKELAAAHLHGA